MTVAALPLLATRVIGTPLALHPQKLDALMAYLGPRFLGQGPVPFERDEEEEEDDDEPESGVATLRVHGTLVHRGGYMAALSGMTGYEALSAQLDEALADPRVSGILLDLDSPGGEVHGLFDLVDRIYEARSTKPVFAAVNEQAFSAGYALASAAQRVFVPRTGGVGSVGVVAAHVDQSQADEAEGLTYTFVQAGDKKTELSPHAPITDAARATLQTEVDRIMDLFVSTVARNRALSPDAVRATEAGLFFGEDAVRSGFATDIGTKEQATKALKKATGSRSSPFGAMRPWPGRAK